MSCSSFVRGSIIILIMGSSLSSLLALLSLFVVVVVVSLMNLN